MSGFLLDIVVLVGFVNVVAVGYNSGSYGMVPLIERPPLLGGVVLLLGAVVVLFGDPYAFGSGSRRVPRHRRPCTFVRSFSLVAL